MAYETATKILRFVLRYDNIPFESLAAGIGETESAALLGLNDIDRHFPGVIERRTTDKAVGFNVSLRREHASRVTEILQSGGLHEYIIKSSIEKEKQEAVERLDKAAKLHAMESVNKTLKIAEESNEIAKKANGIAERAIKKSNSANWIALIAAVAAVISAIFTCNK